MPAFVWFDSATLLSQIISTLFPAYTRLPIDLCWPIHSSRFLRWVVVQNGATTPLDSDSAKHGWIELIVII